MKKLRITDILDKSWDEINQLSNKELYEASKSGRDALIKRKKRLQEAIDKNPTKYSPYGLKELEKGIPEVSTKMNQAELRTVTKQIQALMKMETTTATGAKRVQQQMIRNTLGLPTEGRLTAKQQRQYKAQVDFYEQNPEAITNYWNGFKIFQNEAMHWGLDSQRLKEQYIKMLDTKNLSTQDITTIHSEIKKAIDEHDREQQRKNSLLDKIEGTGGFGIWD